jgi:predicted transposase YbfD/YdcC
VPGGIRPGAAEQRLVLGQLPVDGKLNEITAVPKALAMLSLKGTIVTADALNCQRGIAEQVLAQGGDYVLALKGNQGCLHADIRLFLDDPLVEPDSTHTTVDGDHGRIEIRTALVSSDVAWRSASMAGPAWRPSASSPAAVRAPARPPPKPPITCSARPSPRSASAPSARHHWGIENSLHWVLDVTMNKDHTRNRKDNNGPQNLALLRRLELNLARLEPTKGSMKGKLKRAGWDDAVLAHLLLQSANLQMR